MAANHCQTAWETGQLSMTWLSVAPAATACSSSMKDACTYEECHSVPSQEPDEATAKWLSLDHAFSNLRQAAKVHACRLQAADLHAVEVLTAGSLLSIHLQTTVKLPGRLGS